MGIFGFGKSENLYFPGCYSNAFLTNKIENYKRILKKLKIDFKTAKEETCCGGFLDEAGYEKDLRFLAKENQEGIFNNGYKKIITSCPICTYSLKNYKTILPNWSIEAEFILLTILNILRQNKELVKNYFADSIVYYDSCYLSRYLNITEEPREILSLLGYKVIELSKNKEETICLGNCGGLSITNSELSEKIAIKFIKMLKKKNIKRFVTADLRDYFFLKELLLKLNIPSDELQILEFSDLICDGLGIKKE